MNKIEERKKKEINDLYNDLIELVKEVLEIEDATEEDIETLLDLSFEKLKIKYKMLSDKDFGYTVNLVSLIVMMGMCLADIEVLEG